MASSLGIGLHSYKVRGLGFGVWGLHRRNRTKSMRAIIAGVVL